MSNGLEARNRTLGELTTELRARLGFMTQGPAAQGNAAIIQSFLREAYDFVYGELQPPVMRKKSIITLEPNSYLYDWHDDAADEDITPGNVLAVWLVVSDTIRTELVQGISEYDRALSTMVQRPEKYDTLNGQIEIWPVPDQAYPLIVEHIADKARFTQQSDRPSVPDKLVFQYALAMAKAHYRQVDAQAVVASFDKMLKKEKAQQKERHRYFAGAMQEEGAAPQVVRTADGGYTLRV